MNSTGTKAFLATSGAVTLLGVLANPGQTLHSIEWAWTFLLRLVSDGPSSLKAVALAVLAGWLVNLRVSSLPLCWLSSAGRAFLGQIFGTLASFGVMWWLWSDPMGLIVGALVALATPITWALFLIILESVPAAWANRWACELRGEGPCILQKGKPNVRT